MKIDERMFSIIKDLGFDASKNIEELKKNLDSCDIEFELKTIEKSFKHTGYEIIVFLKDKVIHREIIKFNIG